MELIFELGDCRLKPCWRIRTNFREVRWKRLILKRSNIPRFCAAILAAMTFAP